MFDYRYYDIDKDISNRVDKIFSDPKRHKFYSCFDALNDDWNSGKKYFSGPRGGRRIGSKRSCFYCGEPKAGHAEITEEIFKE